MNHGSVAAQWADGKRGTGKNMSSDGLAVYSYGSHFPIAVWLNERRTRAAFNNDNYSVSTCKHQGHVRSVLNYGVDITFVSADDIKSILRRREERPDEGLYIVKAKQFVGSYDPMDESRNRY